MEIAALTSLLPIRANCHEVRAENGGWQRIEHDLESATHSEVSHSICETCAVELSGEMAADLIA